MSVCPQCGACLPGGESCRDRFDATQLLEIDRPDYYAVHHLSVPCFLLQHAGYTTRGWLAVRELVRDFVQNGLTPERATRRARRTSRGSRLWSYARGPRPPGMEAVVWSRTIADIRMGDAQAYCDDVRAWAQAILRDTAAISLWLSALPSA